MKMGKFNTVKSEYRNNINNIASDESCDSQEEYKLQKEESRKFHKVKGESYLKPIPEFAFEAAGVAKRPSHLGLEREQSLLEFFKTGANLNS